MNEVIAGRLMADFGLLVLTWLVQGIIYPSFLQIEAGRFKDWHKGYTKSIGFIAGPLMLFQAFLLVAALINEGSAFAWINLLLIAFIWWATFAKAVPLHGSLSILGYSRPDIRRLIRINWWRTASWTGVFLITLLEYLLT